jgi:hypothetical protein
MLARIFRIITQLITPLFQLFEYGELTDKENAIYIPAYRNPCQVRSAFARTPGRLGFKRIGILKEFPNHADIASGCPGSFLEFFGVAPSRRHGDSK